MKCTVIYFSGRSVAFIIAESCDAERLKISLMMISSALEEDVIV